MRLAMPQLGESVTEGTIIKWLKKVGEHVGLDEPLVEIETEKVNVEVPSPWEGTLTEVLVPEGETVSVGTDLAGIDKGTEEGEQGTGTIGDRGQGTGNREQSATTPPAEQELGGRQVEAMAGSTRPASSPTQSSVLSPQSSDEARQRYSPAVLRLAEERDIDLRGIAGSGLGGRVTRKDLLSFLDRQGTEPAEEPALEAIQESADTPTQAGRPPIVEEARYLTPRPPSLERKGETPTGTGETPTGTGETPPEGAVGARFIAPPPETPPAPAVPQPPPGAPLAEDEELIHPSPTRRAIAQHMVRSVQTSPHAWMAVEVDLTPLVRFRESVKVSFREREGVDLSYLPFMIKATVLALKENPRLNASWREGEIVLKRRINIGIAVNTDEGLMVPVIHTADNYSIAGLARVASDLASRARSRRLKLEEVQGGTFTVDNTGVFGSVVSAPIINQPQAAIVTMEAIVKRPVVIDDGIAIRSMMNSCISFDHRIVDGGEVGPFMQSLKRHLESFGPDTALY